VHPDSIQDNQIETQSEQMNGPEIGQAIINPSNLRVAMLSFSAHAGGGFGGDYFKSEFCQPCGVAPGTRSDVQGQSS
jgi:hypothetical protein